LFYKGIEREEGVMNLFIGPAFMAEFDDVPILRGQGIEKILEKIEVESDGRRKLKEKAAQL